MYTRHDELPNLSAWPSRVEARYFNVACRALTRKPAGYRLELPGLKSMDMILQAGAWIVVDGAHNDVPVLSWSGFDCDGTRALHEPVACELRYFHGHAGMIVNKCLAAMEEVLRKMMEDGAREPGARVIVTFPDPD